MGSMAGHWISSVAAKNAKQPLQLRSAEPQQKHLQAAKHILRVASEEKTDIARVQPVYDIYCTSIRLVWMEA